MVIGSGDIASVITDREDVIFFCSGVSNSRCTDVNEFEREKKLLLQQDKRKHLVYISTLAIYYGESMYVEHKKCMENIIRHGWGSYSIIRIGNITWGNNPNTLLNYLTANPEAEVQNVWRYLLSKQDFLHWVGMIRVGEKDEMNITGKLTWVPDLVKELKSK